MKLLYSVIICMVVAVSSFAQTNWTGAIDSDWENGGNWTAGVPTTDSLANVFASGNNPVISNSLTIDFTLQNFATITMNADVQNAATISNFASGVLINNAEFTNNLGKFISNDGTIINNLHFINEGFVQSVGTGLLENNSLGVFENKSGATVSNFALITNVGTFNNQGSISNCNTINNSGIFNNESQINQGANGVLNNLIGATFTNDGAISNSGEINNNTGATLTNENEIQNNSDGVILNEGLFVNNSNVNNSGLFQNTGNLNNNNLFTNNFGANLVNTSGNILNNSCATFRQFAANPIACISGCSFTNNGILYQLGGAGSVTITGGTGVVLDNLNQQPSPTANCQNIIVVLDEFGMVSIDALDVNNNSTAGYCSIADYTININSFTCDNVGPNTVILTVIDDLGFADFCSAIVTVVDGIAPVINDCPQDVTVNLDAGECEAIVNFVAPTTDDICGATISKTDNSGLDSGDGFPIGTTTIEYQSTDGSNISTCSFNITIQEFPNPTTSLFCNSLLQVTLDQQCEAIIGADDILEGGPYACYDNYSVDIFYDFEMTLPVATSPLVTSQHIDDTLYVMVTEPIIGNTCWGQIYIKDFIAPEIICENTTITCLEDRHPDSVGYPAVSDNCDNGLFPTYVDATIGGGCANEIITRTWTIVDASGNSNSCQQIITVERPDLSLAVFPQNLDNLELPALDCINPNTHPDATGWPMINGHIIENTCNFNSIYTDQVLQICEGTYDIIRTWQVFDWCASESITDTQIIKVMDSQGPIFSCPSNIEVSTASNSCVASVILPLPVVSDACSPTTNTTITSSAGQISNNNVLINLPIGSHEVTYVVTDGCENESTCSILVNVTDAIAPVAICESAHTVALTIDEPTLVPALVFDDGSYDNCSGLTYLVRRMDAAQCPGFDGTNFGDYVPFYCCDITGVVMVELKVTDASGNSNSCMVEVTVEDNLNPAIQCPPNITLNCNEDYTDLNLTGEAVASDNCSFVLTYFDNGNINNCGGGIINRIWTATDQGGRTASCVQTINIINDEPFYITDTECTNDNPNDGVIWPCDYHTSNCSADTDPIVTGEPQVFEDGCDLISVTYEDIELPITEPACLKIIRVWTIHDWCQYDATTGEGVWTYNQIIKVLNATAPEFTSDCDNQSFCSYQEDCGDAPVTLIASAVDDCTAEEDLSFYYEIDLGNNGTVSYTGQGSDASGSYPLGTHSIKWFVEDGCGNVNTCTYLFVITDCKNPTSYCVNGLAVELMPNSLEIEIQATAFDLGSTDNCSIAEYLIFSPSLGPGQNSPPFQASSSYIFDCSHVGTQTVDFWIRDNSGNWAYCSTYIIIQDNQVACPDQPDVQIAGTITNENGSSLESAMVHIESNAPGIPDPNVTGVDGNYGFPDLPMGYDYTIEVEKNEEPLNGVSTFDLVLMTKHILGVQSLNSPYKMIAADINANGGISTFDLVLLRRLILQIDEELTSNASWRFVDADFVFPDPANPFASTFPEVLSIEDLNQNLVRDFVAIKVGDVNGNALTNNFGGEGEDRNMETPLIFSAKDKLLNPGRLYQIDFTAADLDQISGYQFTLNFDTEMLKFRYIIPGDLPALDYSNFGLKKLSRGALTTSWNHTLNLDEIEEGTIVFSLMFEAKENIYWSEALSISSEYTRAEAYNLNTEILNVQLAFEGETDARIKFEIYPNQPNPFAEETLISFSLPESTPLSFTIQDVSGKVIYDKSIAANEGYNELTINRSDLNGPGVYFYTIKTKTHRVSQRMILIRK